MLIDELNGIEGFVQSQCSLGADEGELRAGQAEHVKFWINALRCVGMSDATQISGAIANVKWPISTKKGARPSGKR